MTKTLIFLLAIFSFGLSQTTLYGLDGWYHTSTIATAGGAGAVPSIDSDRINPAGIVTLPKQVHFSLIKYPAGINSQSLTFIKPLANSNIEIGIRHLNYGSFLSANEDGVENGNYSAGDTWLSASWAKNNNNISFGTTGGIFLSNLESYNATAVVLSAGVLYYYPKHDIRLGISLSNLGIFLARYTEHKDKLPTKIIFSANKGLEYLPLDLNVDIGVNPYNNNINWRIGGIFELPYNLKLSFGVNSSNIEQRTEYKSVSEVFGSSGVGITYTYKQYSIEIGGYSYGTGGWIYGTDFNLKL